VGAPAAIAFDGFELEGALARVPETSPIAIIVTNASQTLAELAGPHVAVRVDHGDVSARGAGHGPTMVPLEIRRLDLVVKVSQ